MSRLRTLWTTVLPSMIAGGLVFSSAFGHAESRDDLIGFWPAASDVTTAKLPPTPPTPPTPPVAKPPAPPASPAPPAGHTLPTPPTPPTPPMHGHHGAGGNGISVSIHDGKVEVDGIRDLVVDQLDSVRDMVKSNTAIPPDVRAKVLARVDKVRAILDKRLATLKSGNVDQLGEELDKMGDEIDKAMEGLDEDLSKIGDKVGKDFAKKFGKKFSKQFTKNWGNFNVHIDNDDNDNDDDDDHAIPVAPDVAVDTDDDDLKDAISDLKGLALNPAQRDAIGKLRTDSDKTVATAKKEIDTLSNKLHTALGNPATTDADVGRYVDQISAQEAVIRKARILAWVNARRVLDDGQRKRIEDAAKKQSK